MRWTKRNTFYTYCHMPPYKGLWLRWRDDRWLQVESFEVVFPHDSEASVTMMEYMWIFFQIWECMCEKILHMFHKILHIWENICVKSVTLCPSTSGMAQVNAQSFPEWFHVLQAWPVNLVDPVRLAGRITLVYDHPHCLAQTSCLLTAYNATKCRHCEMTNRDTKG